MPPCAPSPAARAAWASRRGVITWPPLKTNAGEPFQAHEGRARQGRPRQGYPLDDALKLVKENATAKFDESIDVAVNLGIDAKKSDQTVRGSVVLPAGTGKTVRVAVFAQGDKAKAAKDAGADIVGFDDLAAEIKDGKMDFDVVIATPDAMRWSASSARSSARAA